MADSIIEAPIGVTLKSSDDRDAPWITLRATDVQQLQSQLHELENSGVLVDIGRVAALFHVKSMLGAKLEARPLDPDVDGGSFANVKAAPAAVATPTAKPPATTEQPVTKPANFPAFPAFKAAAAAATPAPAASSAPRETSASPAAAPAANGFPAAPAWKRP
ncbi:hypothetical protein [Arthrobacter sp. ISL-95]|uniref:hypothetical protein n=1 Tax=Arthrobacter sp. ISL-95 TaxID=2819116 RepID=UPI001BE8DD5B|nr:hypothetical protein [Arthrobacter sp. ISL-95]MBT2587984.1 hypothetical protein [Arthrobacter sp. ISL-95]